MMTCSYAGVERSVVYLSRPKYCWIVRIGVDTGRALLLAEQRGERVMDRIQVALACSTFFGVPMCGRAASFSS
jgi:hypothetical protein